MKSLYLQDLSVKGSVDITLTRFEYLIFCAVALRVKYARSNASDLVVGDGVYLLLRFPLDFLLLTYMHIKCPHLKPVYSLLIENPDVDYREERVANNDEGYCKVSLYKT